MQRCFFALIFNVLVLGVVGKRMVGERLEMENIHPSEGSGSTASSLVAESAAAGTDADAEAASFEEAEENDTEGGASSRASHTLSNAVDGVLDSVVGECKSSDPISGLAKGLVGNQRFPTKNERWKCLNVLEEVAAIRDQNGALVVGAEESSEAIEAMAECVDKEDEQDLRNQCASQLTQMATPGNEVAINAMLGFLHVEFTAAEASGFEEPEVHLWFAWRHVLEGLAKLAPKVKETPQQDHVISALLPWVTLKRPLVDGFLSLKWSAAETLAMWAEPGNSDALAALIPEVSALVEKDDDGLSITIRLENLMLALGRVARKEDTEAISVLMPLKKYFQQIHKKCVDYPILCPPELKANVESIIVDKLSDVSASSP